MYPTDTQSVTEVRLRRSNESEFFRSIYR